MLELREVTRHYALGRRGTVRAVDGVSLLLAEGGTLALVGESGCGKTTLARLVLRLERPTSGHILFEGRDVAALSGAALKAYRRQVQAVFQDPYASLNPRLRVSSIISEPILAHERPGRAALAKRVEEVLDVVGLPAAAARLYPHEFSGGQRQRIAIARALALRPRLLVLDEPVSALDVSIRAQVLNLLLDIQQEFGLTYLLIAHDLALVEHVSSRVAVIYLGGVAEAGPTAQVFAAPAHPYTRALLDAVPRPDPDHLLPDAPAPGEPASALHPPQGCRFHPRCVFAMPACRAEPRPPALAAPGGPGHVAACHLLQAGSHA
ncbi:MAG TPA: oligopeptide/dipeptide ABC transporter ATP-binding protein [Crenalkalicoccus sp.]|jgi:oligopeptide/dipeptide ABC transporter ATP-binding protein|nr:oligopeptide/dipeptide ABC transporter ATP-binding protein [Crenalkalicoccus sp.]